MFDVSFFVLFCSELSVQLYHISLLVSFAGLAFGIVMDFIIHGIVKEEVKVHRAHVVNSS